MCANSPVNFSQFGLESLRKIKPPVVLLMNLSNFGHKKWLVMTEPYLLWTGKVYNLMAIRLLSPYTQNYMRICAATPWWCDCYVVCNFTVYYHMDDVLYHIDIVCLFMLLVFIQWLLCMVLRCIVLHCFPLCVFITQNRWYMYVCERDFTFVLWFTQGVAPTPAGQAVGFAHARFCWAWPLALSAQRRTLLVCRVVHGHVLYFNAGPATQCSTIGIHVLLDIDIQLRLA